VLACFRRLRLPIPRLVVDGEAVEFGKPHPEGFLRAASCLGVAPTHCLVIEDAAAGVAAARSAGMAVFGIASTESPERLAAADRVFESLRDATPAVQLWLELPDCAAQSQQSG
jgi:sugar-phosphatase